jgi:hypothetical protein
LERLGTEWTFVSDWMMECKSVTDGERCTNEATFWISYHHVGACDHPSLDEDGCSSGWVCALHLWQLRNKAARAVRYYNPNRFVKWWTLRRPFCTCGLPIQHEGDVLREVLLAWQ